MYLLATPKLLRAMTPSFAEWDVRVPVTEPAVYLTFDDGPHPEATSFALDQLAHYEARATFFCIGKNVEEHPELYQRISAEGHTVGNHTHNHLNGWKTRTQEYMENIRRAETCIESKLFRPPYGRIRRGQANRLQEQGFRLIMWSLLSGDFDTSLEPVRCLENVVFNLKPGDIVIFHDSAKAWERMSYVLPRVLEHCRKKKWAAKAL